MWKSVNGFLCVLIGNSDAAQNPQDCVPLSISKVKSAESNFRDAFNWGSSFICGGVKGEKETLPDLNMFNIKSVARLSAFVLTLFHRFSFFFFFKQIRIVILFFHITIFTYLCLFILEDPNWDRLWEIQRGNLLRMLWVPGVEEQTLAALQLSASTGDSRSPSQCWQTQLPWSSLWPGSFLAFDKRSWVVHWPALFIYSVGTGSSAAVSHAVQIPGTQRWLNVSSPFSGWQADELRFAKRVQTPLYWQIHLSPWNVLWPWPEPERRQLRQLLGGVEPWPSQRPMSVLTDALWSECENLTAVESCD